VPLVASPIRFDGEPMPIQSAPPLLGEHNESILTELGYTPAAIEALRAAEVI